MADDPQPPKQDPQITAFVGDIQRVIDRYAKEFDLPLAAVLGALEVVKISLYLDQTRE